MVLRYRKGQEKMDYGSADTIPLRPTVGRKERRRRYAPQLGPDLLHRLYLLSQQANRPMTKLLNEALEQFLFKLEVSDERERLL